MLSYRAHQVDVEKGDLPGHPFRGNQCVDEDWQPQPGDPCGSDGDGDRELAVVEVPTSQDGHMLVDELRGDARQLPVDVVERWHTRMAEVYGDDYMDVEPHKFVRLETPKEEWRASAEDKNLSAYSAHAPGVGAWVHGGEWIHLAQQAAAAVDAEGGGHREFVEMLDEYEASSDYQVLGMNRIIQDMYQGAVSLESETVLWRGASEGERAGGKYQNMSTVHPADVRVGDVVEPSFFLSTSTSVMGATSYAKEWQDMLAAAEPESLVPPLEQGELTVGGALDVALRAGHDPMWAAQMAGMYEQKIEFGEIDEAEPPHGYLSRIVAPADTEVIPYRTGEDEVVLLPGTKLRVRRVVDNVVIGWRPYRRFVEWEVLPPDTSEQHFTDDRS